MRSWLILAFAVSLWPATTFGQAAADSGAKLESVHVTGSTRFGSDQIAAAIGLHPGAMVTREDLQKAANDLAQLGVFANVNYRYETLETGVRAEYQVTDAPGVPVSFDNFPWFSDEELAGTIKKAGVLFDGTAPVHGTVLDAMSSALEKLTASRGVFTGVSHMLIAAPVGGTQVQQFRIEQSDVKIGSIEFSDPLAQGDHGIHTRLADLVGQPFSRSTIGFFELEQVRPVYLAHGYLRVRFGPPSSRIAEGATGAAAKNVAVVVSVDPGPAFVWSGAVWIGNAAVSSLELEQSIPLHRGDPADGTKIETGWESVRSTYAHRGYLGADIKPTAHLDDASRQANYTVIISEGPQYRMDKLVLSGLSAEGERRIRAAWRIPAGAVFDQDILQEFLDKGITLAFNGLPVHYEKIGHFIETNPSNGTVDVLLDFQ